MSPDQQPTPQRDPSHQPHVPGAPHGNPGGGDHHQGDSPDGAPRKRRRRGGRGRGRGDGSGGQGPSNGGGQQAAHANSPANAPARVPPPSTRKKAPSLAPGSHTAEIFELNTPFTELGLREDVLRGVTEAGFVHPTAIQATLIPTILSGRDVLGQAKTGTGKTAAFGLPLLSRIVKGTPFQALVLVPTRELAIQVATDLNELGRYTGLSILPVYGGQNIQTQANLLARGPEIIVATPGRVMDMVERRYIHYTNIRAVVLDEVDRMLDIGFRDDIRRILRTCPVERQTVFVSATISSDIESLARSFAKDAVKIVAAAGSLTVSLVKQFYLAVEPWDKRHLLAHLLTHEEPALTLVFCRMKRTVDELVEFLARKRIDSHAIHGDMYQSKRNKVIEQLHAGELSVLIASDLASRGLDVDGITHVINYDLPEDPEIYVHRIGRTARAGRAGTAWSLVTPEQGDLLTTIERFINTEIPKLDYPDFAPGPVPRDIVARKESEAARLQHVRSYNRYAETGSESSPAIAAPQLAKVDPSKFPGGIVPAMMPMKRLGGRVKTARSLKAALSQVPPPKSEPPPAL